MAQQSQASESGNLAVQLDILKVDAMGHSAAVQLPDTNLAFRGGDRLSFRMENTGRQPIDVTLLYIDSNYGIYCVYPRSGENNRLQPGDRLLVPPSVIDGTTIGLEHLALIAVRGQGPSVDFSLLEQDSLEEAKSRGVTPEAMQSPLGMLMKSALYGDGKPRGLSRTDVDSSFMQLISWRVYKGPRL